MSYILITLERVWRELVPSAQAVFTSAIKYPSGVHCDPVSSLSVLRDDLSCSCVAPPLELEAALGERRQAARRHCDDCRRRLRLR